MLRLWLAVISVSLCSAALYALGGYITVIGDGALGDDTPSIWNFIIPGFFIGLLYAIFFLSPIYFLVCRYLKKHRGYFYGVAISLWLLFSLLVLYYLGMDVRGVTGTAITLFPLGAISAAVFGFSIGRINETPST